MWPLSPQDGGPGCAEGPFSASALLIVSFWNLDYLIFASPVPSTPLINGPEAGLPFLDELPGRCLRIPSRCSVDRLPSGRFTLVHLLPFEKLAWDLFNIFSFSWLLIL